MGRNQKQKYMAILLKPNLIVFSRSKNCFQTLSAYNAKSDKTEQKVMKRKQKATQQKQ